MILPQDQHLREASILLELGYCFVLPIRQKELKPVLHNLSARLVLSKLRMPALGSKSAVRRQLEVDSSEYFELHLLGRRMYHQSTDGLHYI